MWCLDTWVRGYLIKHNAKKDEEEFRKSQHDRTLKVIYELKDGF